MDTNPTGSDDADKLLLGDLNAYAMEDPVQYLLDQGYTDLADAFAAEGAEFNYSFGFPLDLGTSPQVQGFGTLDYALASGSLVDQVTGAAEWHINADEPSVLDFNTNFKSNQLDLYSPDPFRASDHDPIILGLSLSSEPELNVITGTDGRDQINGTDAADLISGLGGGDRVNAGGGKDVIIAGSGARNILNGGEDGDLFVFDAAIAEDRARDSYYLRDFNAAEDQIDLGGAEVSRVSDGNGFVRLFLEGGRDFILVYNVDGIEEISFVDEGLV